MKSLLQHLESNIIINDLLVKKMKYEVQLLFRDTSKQNQAKVLAKKINNQLDTGLVGLKVEDKEVIRKKLIASSFMVQENPTSEHIDYRHVFVSLTDYDETTEETYLRLTHWLNLNTELTVDPQVVTNYILQHKTLQDDSLYNRIHRKSININPTPQVNLKPSKLKKLQMTIPFFLVALVLFLGSLINSEENDENNIETFNYDVYSENLINLTNSKSPDLTTYTYEPLNYVKIHSYLQNKKNSLLTTENYLHTIDAKSKDFDIDPLLLISIIGHEQNFVPIDHNDAALMINNPYNVFGSWLAYNTNFKDSTIICLNTIETSKSTKPNETDLLEYLNLTYAEDPDWYKGVKQIYKTLKKLK